MKKYILAAIVSVFICSAAQAQSSIEAISTDSKIAASSQDLSTARDLSGKQIDGMMLGLKAGPVEIDGDIQPIEEKELVLSESKKINLKGGPVPSPVEVGNDSDWKIEKPGFFAHMLAAVLAPITVPLSAMVIGAGIGFLAGDESGKPVTGAVIGGLVGLALGLTVGKVLIPIVIVLNVIGGLYQLFKGNL